MKVNNNAWMEPLVQLLSNNKMFVRFDSTATTASINVADNTVIFPTLMDTPDMKDVNVLFVTHEVAHHLYTPARNLKDYQDNFNLPNIEHAKFLATIVNIVEDPRIERNICEKYRPLRKIHISGYNKLYQKDFFPEIADPEEEFLNVLNQKIKLQDTKYISKVPAFSCNEEEEFFNRSKTTKNFAEVESLAFDIYNYIKKKIEDNPDYMKGITSDLDSSDILDSQKRFEEAIKKLNKMSEEEKEKFIQAVKDKSKLQQVGYEKIPNLIPRNHLNINNIYDRISYSMKCSNDYLECAKHISRSFSFKKNAHRMKLTKRDDHGILNETYLHAYKYDEDNLFLKKKREPRQKSHGVIVLLDSSGSTQYEFNHYIETLLAFYTFCRRNTIPMEVYFYSSPSSSPKDFRKSILYEVLNTSWSIMKCDNIVNSLKTKNYGNGFDTPNTVSMFLSKGIIKEFHDKHKVDVVNYIFITDGGDNVPFLQNGTVPQYLEDPVTYKTYENNQEGMIKNIKDTFEYVNTIGIFIDDYNNSCKQIENTNFDLAYNMPSNNFNLLDNVFLKKVVDIMAARCYTIE